MKTLLIFLLLTQSANALFDDKFIEPFLGPYKLTKAKVGTCPKAVLLMAACTLGELTLHNPEEMDFIFERFIGIEEGEMVTSISGKPISYESSTLSNKLIRSKKKTFFSRRKNWLETEKSLKFLKKGFHYKRFSAGHKRSDCIYSYDQAKNDLMMKEWEDSQKK